MQLEYFSIFQQLYHRFLALVLSFLKLPKTASLIPETARATGKLRNNYEIENAFFVFLSSYKNTCNSLGELEKAVETLACGSCTHSISRSPILSRVFL